MTAQSARSQDREFAFSEREFQLFSDLARAQTGIVLGVQKKDMVYSRLVRRLRALKFNSFDEYCQLITAAEGKEEIVNFVNAITTNLTHFFREPHHFDHLREQVLPPILADRARKKPKHLRIWSAGCSAGMEAFSIAMVVKEMTRQGGPWDALILATDIDTNMLAKGRTAEYPIDQLDNIPTRYRQDLTISANREKIRMSEELQSLIVFNHLNLLSEWPMRGLFDAIFCRNVVIYFDKPTQHHLFERMAGFLKPKGWLYVGHSENLSGLSDQFDLMGRTIYQKK